MRTQGPRAPARPRPATQMRPRPQESRLYANGRAPLPTTSIDVVVTIATTLSLDFRMTKNSSYVTVVGF